MTGILPFLIFLYGLLAGFLMFRLRPAVALGPSEERVLVAAGWAVMALSLTLALGLIGFAVTRAVIAG